MRYTNIVNCAKPAKAVVDKLKDKKSNQRSLPLVKYFSTKKIDNGNQAIACIAVPNSSQVVISPAVAKMIAPLSLAIFDFIHNERSKYIVKPAIKVWEYIYRPQPIFLGKMARMIFKG